MGRIRAKLVLALIFVFPLIFLGIVGAASSRAAPTGPSGSSGGGGSTGPTGPTPSPSGGGSTGPTGPTPSPSGGSTGATGPSGSGGLGGGIGGGGGSGGTGTGGSGAGSGPGVLIGRVGLPPSLGTSVSSKALTHAEKGWKKVGKAASRQGPTAETVARAIQFLPEGQSATTTLPSVVSSITRGAARWVFLVILTCAGVFAAFAFAVFVARALVFRDETVTRPS